MPRNVLLQTRVAPALAARVRLQADQSAISTSEWIADVLRRELAQAGAADALAERNYELLATLAYMLRSLMIDAMGAAPTEQAIDQAAVSAAEDLAQELDRELDRQLDRPPDAAEPPDG